MPVEFIGNIGFNPASESNPAPGSIFDLDVAHVERAARIHEEGGFDRALVAFGSTTPESMLIASHAASVTERLGFMIAHRPGWAAPTVAARMLTTLDQFTRGRIAVHIITGGLDADMRQDGDHLNKAERYARTDEYIEVMRKVWTSPGKFDHKGRYYDIEGGYAVNKPLQKPHIPIFFGGASEEAIAVAGKHADMYALWGETQDQVREIITRLSAEAAKHGRTLRFSLSFRLVMADTEEAAWKRADDIVARIVAARQKAGLATSGHAPAAAGSQRLLELSAQGERLDKRLWTGVAAVVGGAGGSTGLVGTPEQVAEALMDYYDLGVTTFLIRGFDPHEDAIAYGRDLIPLVRKAVAERDAQLTKAAG